MAPVWRTCTILNHGRVNFLTLPAMKVWAAGITAGTVALLVGGAFAVAATQNTTTLAPGLRIAGTDVSGMTLEQALAAVGSRAASPPRVTVTAGKNTWTLSAEKLGWHADAQTSVDAALKITQERGVLQKLQGMIGQAPTQDIPLTAAVDPAKARTTLTTLTAGEQRQWQRQVWAGAIAWGAEAPKDLNSRILPDFADRTLPATPRAVPYPVPRDVAAGLGEAMRVGLLQGPVWTSWPAARDGRPLIQVWEGIALSGGLE